MWGCRESTPSASDVSAISNRPQQYDRFIAIIKLKSPALLANGGDPTQTTKEQDELIAQLKADPKGAYFEIEGHTDNTGAAEFNKKLGLDRAEAVKAYLYEKHQIPLHKINVISYGEEKPVAPNTTRQGRAQNRRVVVRVLS